MRSKQLYCQARVFYLPLFLFSFLSDPLRCPGESFYIMRIALKKKLVCVGDREILWEPGELRLTDLFEDGRERKRGASLLILCELINRVGVSDALLCSICSQT